MISGTYKFDAQNKLLYLKIEKSGVISSNQKKEIAGPYFPPTEWFDYDKPIEKVLKVTFYKPSKKHDAVFKLAICEGVDWSTPIKNIKKCKTAIQGIMRRET